MAQAQIAVPETQPVRAVQSAFNFDLRTTEPGTDFFPRHAPAVSVPADGVVLSHSAGHAHTQDFFQVLFAP